VSYLFVYSGLIGVLIQGGLLGRLVKASSEKSLLLSGLLLLSIAYVTFPWTPALAPLLGVLGLMSVGTGLTSSLLPTLVSKRAPATEQGSALGISHAAGSLARSIGPFLGGIMIAYAGQITPFIACAVLTLIACLLSFVRLE
jgi:MFS transporter, DHA1 family, tetracycline resistance protein